MDRNSDSSGDFVITWYSAYEDGSGYGIYAKKYNAQGIVQWREFLVNTYTTNNQVNPCVAMDSQGDFIIAWQGVHQIAPGPYYGIYAQRFINTSNFTPLSVNGVTIACSGDSITLGVNPPATGLTYQWYKDAIAIPTAIGASYKADTSGTYSVIATDSTTNYYFGSTSITIYLRGICKSSTASTKSCNPTA